MVASTSQKRLIVIGGSVALVVLLTLSAFINRQVTLWVEGPRFEDMLNRETSKGLKFEASYAPLDRVGLLGLRADSFTGVKGCKTIQELHAYDISGTFDPLGIALRRWQIDSLHIKSGSVMLQKTEATPGASKGVPWPPWWALFWPYRVHLSDVKVDDANILWILRDKESGIYDTFLEITPNGRDFEYDAHGGVFAAPMTPSLKVVHAHLLIRKPRLYCSEFILNDDPAHPGDQLRLQGDAGLQDDRSIHLKVDLASLNVAPWLPENSRAHVEGLASGHFDYSSSGTGLETGSGTGNISVTGGRLVDLAPVHKYAVITGSPDPGDLSLKVCRADASWDKGAISVENIEVESEGVFRFTGAVTIAADKTLSGQIEFGLTDTYLHWLPTAETAIFTRAEGPYHFTTIHISGTVQKPGQDLSPRIAQEIGKSPLLAIKLFFNEAGEWFDSN